MLTLGKLLNLSLKFLIQRFNRFSNLPGVFREHAGSGKKLDSSTDPILEISTQTETACYVNKPHNPETDYNSFSSDEILPIKRTGLLIL